MTKLSQKCKSFLPEVSFVFPLSILAILFMNGFLKFRQYTSRSILWSDEIKLAFNILERDYAQFFETLSYHQVAPPLWMIATKFVVATFGDSEFVFRVIPFAASLLSPPMLYFILRKETTSLETLSTVILFCLAPLLLRYGSEFKPYSVDVLWALTAYFLFITKREKLSGLFLWGKGVFLVLMPLLSIPSFFIILGILTGEVCLKDYKKRIIALFALGLFAWFSCYLAYYAEAKHTLFMQNFWGMRVGTIHDSSGEFVMKNYENFRNIFSRGFGFDFLWPLAALFFFAGMIRWFVKNRFFAVSFFTPILLTLLFSFFNRYPFYMRMVLFLFPAFAIAMVAGISIFLTSQKWALRLAGIVFLFLFLLMPLKKTAETWSTPFQQNQTEKLFRFMSQSVKRDDRLYIYYRTRYEWDYYWEKMSKEKLEIIRGEPALELENQFAEEIKRISKKGRTWLVFSQCYFWKLNKIKKRFIAHIDLDKECTLKFQDKTEFAYFCDF